MLYQTRLRPVIVGRIVKCLYPSPSDGGGGGGTGVVPSEWEGGANRLTNLCDNFTGDGACVARFLGGLRMSLKTSPEIRLKRFD